MEDNKLILEQARLASIYGLHSSSLAQWAKRRQIKKVVISECILSDSVMEDVHCILEGANMWTINELHMDSDGIEDVAEVWRRLALLVSNNEGEIISIHLRKHSMIMVDLNYVRVIWPAVKDFFVIHDTDSVYMVPTDIGLDLGLSVWRTISNM